MKEQTRKQKLAKEFRSLNSNIYRALKRFQEGNRELPSKSKAAYGGVRDGHR